MNKIIFLDIDGVLNSTQYWESIQDKKKTMSEIEFDLDPKCLRNLKKIVDETNSKIVVTSTWKRIDKINSFKRYIPKYGLHVYDQTPCHPDGAGHRGDEIRQYLKEHESEIEKFILLDDEEFPDFNELTNYLVKTNFYKGGLCGSHVKEAVERLGRVKKEHEMER